MILSPGIAVLREGKKLVHQLRKASSDEPGNRKEQSITQKWRPCLKSACAEENPTPHPNLTSQTFLHQFSLITMAL